MQGTQTQRRPDACQTVRRYGSSCRIAVAAATLFLLTGCGHTLTGVTYRAQVGRSVSELFRDGTTNWQAGAEFRYEVKR